MSMDNDSKGELQNIFWWIWVALFVALLTWQLCARTFYQQFRCCTNHIYHTTILKVAVVGACGAGFGNLVFAQPPVLVLIIMTKNIVEHLLSHSNKDFSLSHTHTGVALKLGMTPRLIIVENFADDKYYPYDIIVTELEKRLA